VITNLENIFYSIMIISATQHFSNFYNGSYIKEGFHSDAIFGSQMYLSLKILKRTMFCCSL